MVQSHLIHQTAYTLDIHCVTYHLQVFGHSLPARCRVLREILIYLLHQTPVLLALTFFSYNIDCFE